MPKQIVTIEAVGYFKLHYDPKSKAFKEALKSFLYSIDKLGNAESMLKHVAFHVNRFGSDSMVEGVGYVQLLRDKKEKSKEPFSGIYIEDDEPDFDFEIN